MLALYRSGREAEAVQAYEDARDFFARELKRAPNPTLTKLHEAILRRDPMLDARSGSGRRSRSSARSGGRR